ncbi:MAG: UDP-N-acetylglucosamine 4,6-dehydratase (inverting) [Candidatus Lindowbacteria bacterium RIFCSPLOWO2_12_FULL_62_27]|nr:MAG: UDP-N-acetylglucosamine 4,6-dehydratase (inverting) [Candidatus Lindowbacteria bacterium RIFCSPLOWO2_12_FULL_62_27]
MIDLNGRVVLVTGGTGSFGRHFARFVLDRMLPEKLIIFSRDELKQVEMQREFVGNPAIRFFIGDVRDKSRLDRAFQGVDIVIHAAALKQVPTLEYNPIEAVKTNVIGAENVLNAAIDQGVRKVIALSTDKAVHPVNLYGATKLCAEKLFVAANVYSGEKGTRFSVVRYGNVLASRGSVVPLFLEQRESGKLIVTDPRMTRFWMSLDNAVEFVLTCLERMHGGEILVPKIASTRVVDIARLIAPDCELEFIGKRPGEKIHEVLITEDESEHTREFDDHYVIYPAFPPLGDISKNGRRVKSGFRYASNQNDIRLSQEFLSDVMSLTAACPAGVGSESETPTLEAPEALVRDAGT